jgi:DNA-binding Xre family transcriptional regulator
MGASYKKLWKLLIDKDMVKRDLCEAANISGATMAKLGKGENVNTDILLRICVALKCDIADIMEVAWDEPDEAASLNAPTRGDSKNK